MTAELHRPNILLLVSEDCPPRLGCYGDPLAHTPNIDEVAGRATRFEQAFSVAPVCAPSRFALVSGMYPATCGPAQHMEAKAAFPAGLPTLPELATGAGYYTINNSKTHYNIELRAGEIWADSSKTAHWRNRAAGQPFFAQFNLDLTHESAIFGAADPASPRLAHTPDPATVDVPAYLPDSPNLRREIAHYYGVIAEMDRQFGERVGELGDEVHNTVIIYTSDHGGVFPRSKRFCYDEGLRVPLLLSLPERLQAEFGLPAVVNEPVCTVDVAATVADLCGVEIPSTFQGGSLLRHDHSQDRVVFGGRDRMDERWDMMRTARSRRFRYIRNYDPHRTWAQHQGFAWQAEGYRDWERLVGSGTATPEQLLFWAPNKPAEELYDLQTDPQEQVNLATRPEYAAVRDDLTRRLDAHLVTINDNGFLAEDSELQGYRPSRAGGFDIVDSLALANQAIRRDPAWEPVFTLLLDDPAQARRFWAASALLMLTGLSDVTLQATRRRLDAEPDHLIAAVLAELLARDGDEAAVSRLVNLTEPQQGARVRLRALNALLVLPPNLVLPQLDDVRGLVDDPDQYVRGAARHLVSVLDGSYRPDSVIFDWSRADFARSQL